MIRIINGTTLAGMATSRQFNYYNSAFDTRYYYNKECISIRRVPLQFYTSMVGLSVNYIHYNMDVCIHTCNNQPTIINYDDDVCSVTQENSASSSGREV
ncbi:MAG TPA: hypothetical protein VJ695_09110 [Nitrososphaera sp.]|nr:hypothetical protein [Nitrososphaera sp.]